MADKPLVIRATLIMDFDAWVRKDDHWPAMVEVTSSAKQGTVPKTNRLYIDRNKLKDLVAIVVFSKQLSKVERISWATPVDQHCSLAMESIRKAAKRAFRHSVRVPVKPFTTEVILSTIGSRKYLRRLMRKRTAGQLGGVSWEFFQWGLGVALVPFERTCSTKFLVASCRGIWKKQQHPSNAFQVCSKVITFPLLFWKVC